MRFARLLAMSATGASLACGPSASCVVEQISRLSGVTHVDLRDRDSEIDVKVALSEDRQVEFSMPSTALASCSPYVASSPCIRRVGKWDIQSVACYTNGEGVLGGDICIAPNSRITPSIGSVAQLVASYSQLEAAIASWPHDPNEALVVGESDYFHLVWSVAGESEASLDPAALCAAQRGQKR